MLFVIDAHFTNYGFPLLLAQVSLLAVWFAMGCPSFAWRWPLVLALLLAVCLTRRLLWHRPRPAGLSGEALLVGQWLLVQIPMWGMRATMGWQLTTNDVVPFSRSLHQEATLMRSVVIGVVGLTALGALLALEWWPEVVPATEQTLTLVVAVAVLVRNATLAWLTAIVVWSPRMRLRSVAFLAGIGAAIILGEQLVWGQFFPDWSLNWEGYLGCGVPFAGTLLYLRLLGYQLTSFHRTPQLLARSQ